MCRIWAAESTAFPCATRGILSSARASFPSMKTPGRRAPLKRPGNFSFWATPIEILSEHEFLSRFGLIGSAEPIRRLYTIGQLAQILSVKRDVIRHWMRAGLICPVEIVHRLAFFDFVQVQSAKTLCDLTKRGVSAGRIRASLEQLRRWLPDLGHSLAQLAVLEDSGRLLVRYGDCGLMESSGQLQFDFATDDGRRVATHRRTSRPPTNCLTMRWSFTIAVATPKRPSAYLRAIELDPAIRCSISISANVHYEQGHLDDSAAAYLAATQRDPGLCRGLECTGMRLESARQIKGSHRRPRRAVELVPDYGDAHFNLASELESQGESQAAREHWRRYLQLDSTGPWADTARAVGALRNGTRGHLSSALIASTGNTH